MKLLIKHQSLIFIIALPATLFLICLIWFFPHEISMIFLFHWFFLVFIIFLLFHPFSKIYLTQPMNRSDNQMLKFKNLLLTRGWKIILLQICFQILSFEMLYFTTHSLPILNSAKTPNFMEVLRFFNLNEGLFPWLIVILITINFAYSSYIKNQNAYFNTIIQCLVNSSPIEKFGVVCNFIARGITLLAMSSTLLLLALWLVHLFFPHLLAATTGFNLASFALIVTSFIIFVSKSVRNTIKKKFQIKSYFILKLLIIILTLALLITFLTLLYHPLHIVSFKTPGVILSLQNKGTFIFLVVIYELLVATLDSCSQYLSGLLQRWV